MVTFLFHRTRTVGYLFIPQVYGSLGGSTSDNLYTINELPFRFVEVTPLQVGLTCSISIKQFVKFVTVIVASDENRPFVQPA